MHVLKVYWQPVPVVWVQLIKSTLLCMHVNKINYGTMVTTTSACHKYKDCQNQVCMVFLTAAIWQVPFTIKRN